MANESGNDSEYLREELERRMRMEVERVEYEKYVARKKQQQQLFATISFATASLLGIFVYLFFQNSSESPIFRITLLAVPLAGLAIFALFYLQSTPVLRSRAYEGENYDRLRFYLDQRLSDVSAVLENNKDIQFTDVEKAKVLSNIQAKLESDALQDYVAGIRELVASRVKEETLSELFDQIIRRLVGEVRDLAKRGNLNLIIGILTTLVGLVVLGYAVFYSPITHSPEELLSYFVPRTTLAILIEVFAYFFLRLYKQSLSEIKYFQNEITNIEARQLALHIAARSDDAVRSKVVEELSKTERNFILSKGQTTVDLERERISQGAYSEIGNIVKGILKKRTEG